MEDRDQIVPQAGSERDAGYNMAHAIIIYLVALLLSIPLFIILYPFVPTITLPIGTGYRVDHLLTFALVLTAFIILVRRFQMMVYLVLIIGLGAITVTGLAGGYGFRDLYGDYAMFLHSLRASTVHVPLAAQQMDPFVDADRLRAAIDNEQPAVRSFAVAAATAHFSGNDIGDDEFTLVQCFSIFKTINSQWQYVSDAKGAEYFATASESVGLLAGDCDDHAILMAACIKAVGGEVRLVRTTGHIYPELKVGDEKQLERAAYLIRRVLFQREVGDAPLYYHTDPDGTRWINMDYTRNYPGGELMEEDIVGILGV
ncbi:MAG: transglutaminase family protein [Flavobacteriales bacterium]